MGEAPWARASCNKEALKPSHGAVRGLDTHGLCIVPVGARAAGIPFGTSVTTGRSPRGRGCTHPSQCFFFDSSVNFPAIWAFDPRNRQFLNKSGKSTSEATVATYMSSRVCRRVFRSKTKVQKWFCATERNLVVYSLLFAWNLTSHTCGTQTDGLMLCLR